MRADVTEGVQALADAIGDAQAVVCALGYNGGSDPQGFVDVDSKVHSLCVSDKVAPCCSLHANDDETQHGHLLFLYTGHHRTD